MSHINPLKRTSNPDRTSMTRPDDTYHPKAKTVADAQELTCFIHYPASPPSSIILIYGVLSLVHTMYTITPDDLLLDKCCLGN